MLSGFYTAGSGILNQQRNVNIIGNNISNNQTVGYKPDTRRREWFRVHMNIIF